MQHYMSVWGVAYAAQEFQPQLILEEAVEIRLRVLRTKV